MNNDLISREALKEHAQTLLVGESINTYFGINLYKMFEEIIDNAPAVQPKYFPPCEDCNKKMEEIRRAYDKMKAMESSPGEWIAREDMDYLDENKVVHNHFECSKCGLIHNFTDGHTSQYNFCPQCGYSLKWGAK